jgi:hypothetical protein
MNSQTNTYPLRGNLRLLVVAALVAVFVIPALVLKTIRVVSAAIDDGSVPQAQSDFVRVIPFTANDVVYSPTTKMLYASVPSTAGSKGNSITPIDPATGTIGTSVFIGSEPNKLALSDDGASLYASLDGAYSIRRFDLLSQTAGAQFPTGRDSFFGLYRVGDLAVAPGNPGLVAVARQYPGTSPPEAGVAIFDNGVQRPTTGPGHIAGSDYLTFSASAAKLYGSGIYSGLTTLKIDANGVTITGTSANGAGARVKFDNGLVYAANGQIIDPDISNGTLKGTFPGVTNNGTVAFVPDSSVGRAYYLVADQFGSSTRTLKAYDINTFLQVGSLTITGVSGDATNMVRWGTNGLAFRTTGNQLFIIQTSLIPSNDPIPTPTATPSPSPSPSPSVIPTFVRQIQLTTNDLIYHNSSQSLYASLPSSVGLKGNSIVPIDPVTATVGNSVFVGSEPSKIALADDLHTIYVGLNGAGAVRRFDLNTQTAGLQFSLGYDPSNGPRTPSDIAVMPGVPGTVAVSRNNADTAIYDDGVQRPQTSLYGNLAFRSPSLLYSSTSGNIARLTVAANGLSQANTVASGSSGRIVYENGLAYLSGGTVVDPETDTIKGTFSGIGFNNGSMYVDSASGRVFFLSESGSQSILRAFDLNTFLPLGTITISGIVGGAGPGLGSLVRWGANGLAFRTSTQVFLIETALVNAAIAVPTPTPTPSPSPSPSPTYIPTFVRKVDLAANDLVYEQSSQAIYASVSGFSATNGNSITRIDPQTGAVGQSVSIGSEPNKLALADDGATLHVSVDGAGAIRRLNISTMVAGPQFTWSNSGQHPYEMRVVPGSPNSIATSDGSAVANGVAIYDDGVRRTNMSRGGAYSIGPMTFGADASRIYGCDNISSGYEFVKFAVSSSGVAPVIKSNNVVGSTNTLKFSNGLVYSSSGKVVDAETPKLMGTFQVFGSSMVVDQALGRVFFISSSGSGVLINAFDMNTFVPLGSVNILSNISGTPTGLVRWGANGLAFRVTNSSGQISANNPASVYLVQTALVSSSGAIPTAVQFSSATYSVSEGVATVTITVNRLGDVSSATNVDYATSDGTATAGSDYTTTSGTLTFAAGQLSRTFTVPIINDSLYEAGSETFNVTLSNPSSGALLGTPATAIVTIQENDSQPSIQMSSSFRATEGNAGTKTFTIPVNLSNPSVQTVSVNYATADNTALAGTDYAPTSGTLVFPPGTTSGAVNVTVNGDTTVEPDETFFIRLTSGVNAFISISQSTVTIGNDDSSIQLGATTYSVGENGKSVNVLVSRSGDTTVASSVSYATSDSAGAQSCNTVNGKASSRCDYITSLGSLTFAAGQSSKTITILLIDDAYAEGDETFTISLSDPSVSALGSNAAAMITITDDDSVNGTNPIDIVGFFVRQHYLDFLNREPDQSGFDFWSNQINSCGSDAQCKEVRRIDVSASFFLSIEFQNNGYLVERFYKVAYGDATGNSTFGNPHTLAAPIVRANEFLTDAQRIGRGVVVLAPGWEQLLDSNKQAYALEFVQTARFTAANAFPTTMTPAAFVDKLNLNAGNVLSASERTTAINLFSGAADSSNTTARAQAVRQVAEDTDLFNAEYNRAFVLAQYFGYLRRNPNDAPESTLDYTGYDFWLTKLNQFNGNYINAEMVKAFLSSIEYRQRFGP